MDLLIATFYSFVMILTGFTTANILQLSELLPKTLPMDNIESVLDYLPVLSLCSDKISCVSQATITIFMVHLNSALNISFLIALLYETFKKHKYKYNYMIIGMTSFINGITVFIIRDVILIQQIVTHSILMLVLALWHLLVNPKKFRKNNDFLEIVKYGNKAYAFVVVGCYLGII